jgi:hypothetical protein
MLCVLRANFVQFALALAISSSSTTVLRLCVWALRKQSAHPQLDSVAAIRVRPCTWLSTSALRTEPEARACD